MRLDFVGLIWSPVSSKDHFALLRCLLDWRSLPPVTPARLSSLVKLRAISRSHRYLCARSPERYASKSATSLAFCLFRWRQFLNSPALQPPLALLQLFSFQRFTLLRARSVLRRSRFSCSFFHALFQTRLPVQSLNVEPVFIAVFRPKPLLFFLDPVRENLKLLGPFPRQLSRLYLFVIIGQKNQYQILLFKTPKAPCASELCLSRKSLPESVQELDNENPLAKSAPALPPVPRP